MKERFSLQKILILSLVCTGLLLPLLLFSLYQRPFAVRFDFKRGEEAPFVFATNFSEYAHLSRLKTPELIQKLRDRTLLEQGYCIRDLAISILVSRNFDIERALNKRVTRRRLVLKEGKSLTLFPGLTETDFINIKAFLEEEKWPYTTKGLFLLLKKKGISDPSLIDAFKKRIEFQLVMRLFAKTEPPLRHEVLIALMIEGGYDKVKNYVERQKRSLDLSDKMRRELLMGFVREGSKLAASLLLRTDFNFAYLNLDDDSLIQLLRVLPKKNLSTAFAKKIAISARSDKVIIEAKKFMGNEVVMRPAPRPSIGKLRPVFRDKPPAAPNPSLHVIQKGETLFSISERYGLTQERLMEYNHLRGRDIRAGSTLRIPRQ